MNSRLSEFLHSVPIVTLTVFVINVAVHVLVFLTSARLNQFSINAHLVLNDGEYYRVVSAAFVHGGVMHIFMNMSSLFQLGQSLETQFGSLQFMFLTIWSVFITGFLYVVISWLISVSVYPPQMNTGGVGFSGVLFTFALLESYHTTEVTRSIFGIINVPAKMYPFILLVALQVWWFSIFLFMSAHR